MDLWASFLKIWEPPSGLDGMAEAVATRAAVGVIFVMLAFTVGPMTFGHAMHSVVRRKTDLFLGGGMGLLVYVVLSTAMAYVLRQVIPVEQLSDLAIGLLSFAAGVSAGALLARFIIWWLRDPDLPMWAQEYRALPDEELMPFERRKREWEQRKSRPRKS